MTEPVPAPTPPHRRWFRVSLRGLMLLVLLVGGGVGWKVSRERSKRQAIAAIRQVGGSILYDYQYSTDPEVMKRIRNVREPAAPRWLRRWLGDDFFRTVALVRLPERITPAVLASVAGLDSVRHLIVVDSTGLDEAWSVLGGLTRLEVVYLAGPAVDARAIATLGTLGTLRTVHLADVGVAAAELGPLARHPDLQEVTLGDCRQLTDDEVGELVAGGFPALECFGWQSGPGPLPQTLGALARHHPDLLTLNLAATPVADADLQPLGMLTRLTTLSLNETRVTDAGLVHLAPLENLETLWLNTPGVTDAGTKAITPLWRLLRLSLIGSKVGDVGLADLATLPRLEDLLLANTPVTDAGLIPLQQFTTLRLLLLIDTAVTPGGVATLQAALPRTKILASPPRRSPLTPNHQEQKSHRR